MSLVTSRTARVAGVVAFLVLAAAAFATWGIRAWNRAHDPALMPYPAPAVAFSGDSSDLQRSVVVPTLDTPLPEGKNAIWCATFQMAWDRLKDDVVGESILLQGAQEQADRLNALPYPPDGLKSDDYYAAAGWTKGGIVDRICDEMRKRFNKEPMELGDDETAAVAYAYLRARVPFTIPYFENREEFLFIDSTGEKTSVSSFGIRDEDSFAYYQLRGQIKILYTPRDCSGHNAKEFAVDLCKTSEPYQIVLACVPPQPTLEATLHYVGRKISEEPGSAYGPHPICDAIVLIPNMNWSIQHRFREVSGPDKRLQNATAKGLFVKEAMQAIDFRLDRSGAELGSEAKIKYEPIPINYVANHPFLLYITKRGGARPFFVMWVDNAELLSKPMK